MKHILLSLILIGVFQISFTQTLKLCDLNNQTVNSGDTIIIDSLSNVTEMVYRVKVINLSTSDKFVFCEKIYHWVVPGTDNTFCFAEACYDSLTMVSGNQFIAAGDTNADFSAHYKPLNHEGTTFISYSFKAVHGDTVGIFVKFTGTLGVKENMLVNSISKPYPNPAEKVVNINYSLIKNADAKLQLFNIIGLLEKEYPINDRSGTVTMDVSDLSSGIYFCAFNVNGKTVKTQKIIISH